MVEALNKTRLRLTYKVTLVTGYQCEMPTNYTGTRFRFTFLGLNRVMDYSERKLCFNIYRLYVVLNVFFLTQVIFLFCFVFSRFWVW